MTARVAYLRPVFFGVFLALSPTQSRSQVYNEEQKSTFIYPINGGWNMLTQNLKREYMGNTVVPVGLQSGNIIGANVQIRNDLNGSGVSTTSSSLYRLNDQVHGPEASKHGGQFHIRCDDFPQCEAFMYGFSIYSSYFKNTNYDSPTNPRGFIKMEYLNAGTSGNRTQASDVYFPIGGWNMSTTLEQTKTQPVSMSGINVNNIVSLTATVYSDVVNNNIEVRSFEQRGKPDLPDTGPGVIFRGGVIDVSSTGPTATLKIVSKTSLFSDIGGNKNTNFFAHGGYTQFATNRGWVKVTVSGTSDAMQPYAVKTRIMPINGWPIVNASGVPQPYKDLTFSTLGVPANQIVHAEAAILSDPQGGSNRKVTNILRSNLSGSAPLSPDGGFFVIQQAFNRIRLYAFGEVGEGHHFAIGHEDPNVNRGWFQVDYLAAVCSEGSGYTRSFIGAFSPNNNDCHGNRGVGPSAIHVIQTKGPDIWNNADKFAFINKAVNAGTTMYKARVDKIENTNEWARAGIMVRSSLTDTARHVAMVVTPYKDANQDGNPDGNGISFTWRTTRGGVTNEASPNNLTAPYWVLIRKEGSNFRGYMSSTGIGNPSDNPDSWTQVGGTISISNFPTNYYVGLCQTAGNNSPSRFNTSVYSNLNF